MSDQHDPRPAVPAWAVERLMGQAAEIAILRARRVWNEEKEEESESLQQRLEVAENARVRAECFSEETTTAAIRQREEYTNDLGRLREALTDAENARVEAERRAEEILATYNEARAGYTAELSSQLEELATATSELAEANAARLKLERHIAIAYQSLKDPPDGDTERAMAYAALALEGVAVPDEDVPRPVRGIAVQP